MKKSSFFLSLSGREYNTWKFNKRMFKCLKRSFELIINIFVRRKGKSNVSDRKGMRIINPMVSHFILEIAVKQNAVFAVWSFSCYQMNIFYKRDVWSVLMSFFQRFLKYILSDRSLISKKLSFIMELYLWRISIKHLRKLKMLTMMEINK